MVMPGPAPDPHLLSWMAFVDGENLTIRGQEVAKDRGLQLTQGRYFERDVFFWRMHNTHANSGRLRFVNPAYPRLQWAGIRSYYYTSVHGDSQKLQSIEESLWHMGFTPKVFKKEKKEAKAKAVDIALTTDMLSHAFGNHYSAAVLVTGDGDFLPVVEQVKRAGKTVIVAAFSNGMNRDLQITADVFFDLTDFFIDWWEATTKRDPNSLK